VIHLTYFRRVLLRPALVTGCVALLSSCTGGSSQSVRTIVFDEATNGELFVQPIQVCNDAGGDCADFNLFADITAKILEQARLKVNFLPTNQLNASRFLSIDSGGSSGQSEFYELSRTGEAGAFGRHPDSTRDSGPINVWFVDTIESANGLTQFGSAWVDGNGVIISEETLAFNGGKGRTDTLAHEIGHNLGLRHTTFGAGGANNLLTDGNRRNTPGDVGDVYPDGAGLSQLTAAQLQQIADSPFTSYETLEGTDAVATEAGGEAGSMDEIAADLAGVPLLSLQLQDSTAEASSIPEPSSWVAIALTGFSTIFLLKKRPVCSR